MSPLTPASNIFIAFPVFASKMSIINCQFNLATILFVFGLIGQFLVHLLVKKIKSRPPASFSEKNSA